MLISFWVDRENRPSVLIAEFSLETHGHPSLDIIQKEIDPALNKKDNAQIERTLDWLLDFDRKMVGSSDYSDSPS